MQITEIRCVSLGGMPMVRVLTDGGLDGYAQLERNKLKYMANVETVGSMLLGEDPVNVELAMLSIRRLGGTKPWGSAVSALETALWDIASQAHRVPVHVLLGGKVRDRVRVYNGGIRTPLREFTPAAFEAAGRALRTTPGGFTIVKQELGYHGEMAERVPNFGMNPVRHGTKHASRGPVLSAGIDLVVECAHAFRAGLGDTVEMALDLGPGWALGDAIKLLERLEDARPIWVEDVLTGDSYPYCDPRQYKVLTASTSCPTHTGENLYLRHAFRDLIDSQAVRVIGPDPCDVGGLAELKWIAELADLYGVMIAPHGVLNGALGLAALVQVSATLPDNFIAFEYPSFGEPWWESVLEGLEDLTVTDGFVSVPDAPGFGVRLVPELAKRYLCPADSAFFD